MTLLISCNISLILPTWLSKFMTFLYIFGHNNHLLYTPLNSKQGGFASIMLQKDTNQSESSMKALICLVAHVGAASAL